VQNPVTRPEQHADVSRTGIGGDPYRWLEADQAPGVTDWLRDQDALFWVAQREWGSRPIFEALLTSAGSGNGASGVTAPVERGGRIFRAVGVPGGVSPVLMVEDTTDGDGGVVVDPGRDGRTGKEMLGFWQPSRTGEFVSYQLTVEGNEQPELHIARVNGERVGDPIALDRPSPVAWLADDSGFYYIQGGAGSEHRDVLLHRLGHNEDVVVFQTEHRQLAVSTSADGRYLGVSSAPGAQTGNQFYLADLTTTGPDHPHLTLLHDGTSTGTQALVRFGPDELIYAITTAPSGGGLISRITLPEPGESWWEPLMTTLPEEVIFSCTAMRGSTGETVLLLSSRTVDRHRLTLHDLTGTLLAEVPVPGSGIGTVTNLTVPADAPDHAWFTYSDFLTPPRLYRYDLGHHTVTPTGTDSPQPYHEARIEVRHFPATDGTQVPIYLITPTTSQKAPGPTILSAYGGFGLAPSPTYSPSIHAWVHAGGAYALAGVRGGFEKGPAWHEAGSGPNKRNAFTDFIDAARWLIATTITTPGQLAIRGASHAGLTVAVAITQAPQLFAAAVCSDPLTDMVRYPALGLGDWWIAEFGDPTDPDQRQRILEYSPYHHIRDTSTYPPVLITSSRIDPRVGAGHARKFAAALQHTNSPLILLRTDPTTGHGPTTPATAIALQADILSFCATHTNLHP
jgi:prolyl oligopeptidase